MNPILQKAIFTHASANLQQKIGIPVYFCISIIFFREMTKAVRDDAVMHGLQYIM